MADDWDRVQAKFARIEQNLTSPKMMRRIGEASAKDATGVIRSRIGDTSMSHWSRRKPLDLTLQAFAPNDHAVFVWPRKNALGASRVLNEGRKSYTKGGRRLTGRVSKKTGKALSRKVKRSSSGHGGKRTWDDGVKLMEKRFGKRAAIETNKVLAREFRG